jgi:hypothetical protein
VSLECRAFLCIPATVVQHIQGKASIEVSREVKTANKRNKTVSCVVVGVEKE